MEPILLRFSKFSELLVGVDGPKATVRDIVAKGDVPFDPKPRFGGQRTYDGEDLVKWLGFEAMRAAGVSLHQAAKLMRYGYVVEPFLEAIKAGNDTSELHLCFATGKPASSGFFQFHYKLFTSSKIADFLEEQARSGPGIEYLVSVPLLPVYKDAQSRAAIHGLALVVGDFFKAAG